MRWSWRDQDHGQVRVMNQLQGQPAEAKPNNLAESPGTDYQQSGVLVGSGAG